MKRLVTGLLTCLLFLACSPESGFLNSAEKREVARLTEERAIPLMDSLNGRCAAFQDSLQPYLMDSILTVRVAHMKQKLGQQ